MFLCYKSMEPLKLCVNSVSKPVSKDYNTTTFWQIILVCFMKFLKDLVMI